MAKEYKTTAMFVNRPAETRFLAMALEEMLGEEKTAQIMESIEPSSVASQTTVAGRPLRFWQGMNRKQMESAGLDEKEISEVEGYFEGTEDTSAPYQEEAPVPVTSVGADAERAVQEGESAKAAEAEEKAARKVSPRKREEAEAESKGE